MNDVDGKPILPRKLMIDFNAQSEMELLIHNIQKNFCDEIQKWELRKNFSANKWKVSEHAEGTTVVLEEGDVFEKVAVTTSIASGDLPMSTFLLLTEKNDAANSPVSSTYYTAGITGVAYSQNPHIPTLNFSYRYFEINNEKDCVWWFGGGSNLTPCILHVHDCRHFHEVLKICCDKYDKNYYPTFKKSCDDHFYLEHRGERRGIGGIFFNRLNFPNKNSCFQFIANCMRNIIPSYMPIVMKNKENEYSANDKEWQLIQRGRYVEYIFICDEATKFALLTPGIQYENVLTCLPSLANWQYNYVPKDESKVSALNSVLRHPIDWV